MKIEIDAEQAEKFLAELQDRLADLSEPLAAMEPIVSGEFERSFAGGRLQRTGRLRRSFTRPGSEGNVSQVGPDQALFGSNLDYADVLDRRVGISRDPAFFSRKLEQVLAAYLTR